VKPSTGILSCRHDQVLCRRLRWRCQSCIESNGSVVVVGTAESVTSNRDGDRKVQVPVLEVIVPEAGDITTGELANWFAPLDPVYSIRRRAFPFRPIATVTGVTVSVERPRTESDAAVGHALNDTVSVVSQP